ncbi:Non-specific serine/threonine protein kinase [Sulfidibacter corallicola]|uniref:Tetratricopeptide repeat protein n=1 Tax=Sulfidibacter corallicola TaxID=2818388 RepID=A0A8A4TYA9_SULCO|nr:tetratricopeptide repeat protein [Sulfidibacter corallicola]QTD51515.1 tetratricopeptide repeat protein [Sulfidibacter corallicola]
MGKEVKNKEREKSTRAGQLDRDRLKELFAQGMEMGPQERQALIANEKQVCPQIARELASLLTAADASESFLEEGTIGKHLQWLNAHNCEQDCATIPGIELIRCIGEGGMGRVFEAQQLQPVKRRIAVKVVKAGFGPRAQEVRARFESERQTLALMNHPHVAQIYGGGQTESGSPYLLMEYVEGVPITEYCDRHRLGLHDRLELFFQVCRGMQHAHQKGIIHRDLKPANVLITLRDNQPVSKIIDFGIAKTLGNAPYESGPNQPGKFFLGTPLYMSPEQADTDSEDVDTRTDVYGLGVILYELLTGQLPFSTDWSAETTCQELIRIVRNKEPRVPTRLLTGIEATEMGAIAQDRGQPTPKALIRALQGDLNAILVKALANDRERRYDTVSGLVEDLSAHLGHRPVLAHAPGRTYQFGKFMRRNKSIIGAMSLIIMALTTGLAVSTLSWWRVSRAQHMADLEAEKATELSLFLINMLKSAKSDPTNGDIRMLSVLQRASMQLSLDEFQLKPEVLGTLHHTLGGTYRALGQLEQSEYHLKRAIEVRRERLGKHHRETLESKVGLGSVYLMHGYQNQALDLLQEACVEAKLHLQTDDPLTLEATQWLGNCYQQQGNIFRAETLHRQVLKGYVDHFGENHLHTLRAKRILAATLITAQQFDEAESLLLDVYRLEKTRLPGDHPNNLSSLRLLARVAGQKGEYARAEPINQHLMDMYREFYGESHQDTLQQMLINAQSHLVQGRLREAEALYKQAYQNSLRSFGPNHLQTQVAAAPLTVVWSFLGKHAEAEDLARDRGRVAREAFGDNHPLTLTFHDALGYALAAQGKHDEADRVLHHSLQAANRKMGEENMVSISLRDDLVFLYLEQNHLEKAHSLAKENLDLIRASHPHANTQHLQVMVRLADVHMRRGDLEDARALYEKVWQIAQEELPENSFFRAEYGAKLARCLAEQGRFNEAEHLYHATLPRMKELEHPNLNETEQEWLNHLEGHQKQMTIAKEDWVPPETGGLPAPEQEKKVVGESPARSVTSFTP